jgi:hypothetical protein
MEDLKLKYRAMIDSLHRRTSQDSLDWRITFHGDLEVKINNYSVRLSNFRDEEGEPFEKVELLKADGSVIDSFVDNFLSGLPVEGNEFPHYYAKMKSLREQAMRKAMGLDAAVDEILSELDDDIPF